MQDHIRKLVKHVNHKDWWHVTPKDPRAYWKRGKFLSSTFKEAEFYGRPKDAPEKVTITSPLVGSNDLIERSLFGAVKSHANMGVRERFALDAQIRRAALQKGYDSVVLMSERGFKTFRRTGRLPRSIELNILVVSRTSATKRKKT
jgi:hypothetical protein